MKGTSALANPVPQDVESAGTEQAFLERYRQEFSRYDRPGVSVDVALFTVAASQLRVLLISGACIRTGANGRFPAVSCGVAKMRRAPRAANC